MFRAATTQLHWGTIILLPSGPKSLDHRNWFPTVSKLSKDTVKTQCTIPLEKRWGEGVLWVLTVIPSVTLIRWNKLINDFLAWSGKHPVSFRKLQKKTKVVVLMKKRKKKEAVCFSGKLKPTGPKSQVHKACFPAVSGLCKDTRKTQCTIPWEWQKRSGESILWVLTAIPVIPIRWNCFERWLPRKKCLADCFIQKIPKLDQSCCFNEEKNETVFLMRILGYKYPDSTFGKYCF